MSWADGGQRVVEDKMLNAVLEQGSFVAAFTGEIKCCRGRDNSKAGGTKPSRLINVWPSSRLGGFLKSSESTDQSGVPVFYC